MDRVLAFYPYHVEKLEDTNEVNIQIKLASLIVTSDSKSHQTQNNR